MIPSNAPKFSYSDFEDAITKLRPRLTVERDSDSEAVYDFALRIEERAQRALATEADDQVRAVLSEILGCCDDPKFISTMMRYFESSNTDTQFWSYMVLTQVGTPSALKLAREKDVMELLESCVTEEDLQSLNLKTANEG